MTSKLRVLQALVSGPAERVTLEKAVGTTSAANVISSLVRLGAVRKVYTLTERGQAIMQGLDQVEPRPRRARPQDPAESLSLVMQKQAELEVERTRARVQKDLRAIRAQRAQELPGTAGLIKS